MTMVKTLTTGLVAGATLLIAASPAEAQWRYGRRGGDRTALAIGAGALGVALGAAIASNGRRDWYGNRGWNGRRGFDNGYYAYGGRPYAYGYGYGRGGYDGWYGRAPRTQCWRERVWDDYRGRWRRVRVCDRF